MAIDLLSIQPHQVSRDLRGYSVFFYGDAKTGKTTTATRFPNHLLAAFEKGYNAIPGAMAQPINTWSEFRQFLKQLRKPEVQAKFETVIIDTADIAYEYTEKYICDNYTSPDGSIQGVDTIGDIPYGRGYTLAANEFDSALRSILMMNYGLVVISHAQDKTFKDEKGEEYNKIVPTLDKKARNIVSRMADIIGYARPYEKDGVNGVRLFMRGTPRFEAGSRFKYIDNSIDFSYDNLVKAIGDAIDKEEASLGTKELFTNERQNQYVDTKALLNYDELMSQFEGLKNTLPGYQDAMSRSDTPEAENFKKNIAPRITQIVERYLGKGQKIVNATRDQVEALSLIVSDMEDLVAEVS